MNSRLQEIKESAVTTKQHDFITEIPYEDFEWLMEQAEKVERYEKAIELEVKGATKILIKKLVEENKL